MRRLTAILLCAAALIAPVSASADSAEAQRCTREAEYYQRKAKGYNDDAEYYRRKAQDYTSDAEYYIKRGEADRALSQLNNARSALDSYKTQKRYAKDAESRAKEYLDKAKRAL